MKQIKLLGVFALALSLALTACGGGGADSNHKHKYGDWTVTKEATCTEDGVQERVCSCGDKQTKAVPAAHKFGDWNITKEATCQEEGSRERVCSVCQFKETEAIEKTEHTWGDWTTVTEADCENPGSRKHECSVCHTEESETVEALGHVYAQDEDGNDVVVWASAPTCTAAGTGEKECTRCHAKTPVTQEALGHDIHLRADTTEPAEGKAAVRIYECSRCDVTYFGFKATEVSANAGRLVFEPAEPTEGQEQGARFWGRPIGNAMELGEDGSASGADAEKIFDRTVQGDLFEYIFDLTAAQVADIGDTCVCVCDAKPADYLGGQDFWACDPSAEEWTPGYYIDDAHEDQTPIADYRYILYVDDQPVSFDPDMKAPVARSGMNTNLPRGEYTMPYKFHLHAGTNKISLRMAGGYRSLFYNFTFRPYVEPQA